MTISSLFGVDERPERMPDLPQTAFFLGCVFKRLGGFFSIDSRGNRGMGRPLYGTSDELPQLPAAEPCERFHSHQEWEGAMKLVEGLIRRMSKEDRDFIFAALAQEAIDDRKFTSSIEEPKWSPRS